MRKWLLLLLVTALLGTTAPAVAQPEAPMPAQGLEQVETPDSFVLSPAYPNPFTQQTRFTLTAHERQHISVELFNVLGRHVRTIFDEVVQAGESRTITLKANDLPPGIYLYRARGASEVTTRQVTLVD